MTAYVPSLQRTAAGTVDYSTRFPNVKGDSIGILVASGTLIPIQATGTGVDLSTNTGSTYTVYVAPKVSVSGTGNTIYTTLLAAWSMVPVNGSCKSLPANAVYYGSVTSYTLTGASAGTSLTASFYSSPIANTCQFNCANGYAWNGSSCGLAAVTGPCTGLPANALYYGSVASYSLSGAAVGTSLTAAYTGGTVVANTCQFSCATNYGWDGVSACVNVNGACTGLPSNSVYYNNTTSYSLANAPYGTTLVATTAGYSASPTVNTCQYGCASGYGWVGGSCLANVSGACTSLPSGAQYYNSSTSYSLSNALNGTTLNALTAGYSSSPTANTCQFKCPSGYNWDSGSSSCIVACPAANGACNGSTALKAGLDCKQLLSNGVGSNGIYYINPQGTTFQDYCDMGNGGWTLAMRMANDSGLGYNNGAWSGNSPFNETDFNPSNNTNAAFKSMGMVQATDVRACRDTSNCINMIGAISPAHSLGFKITNMAGSYSMDRGTLTGMFPPDDPSEPNCNYTWIGGSPGNKVRIGLTANNENDCGTPDAAWWWGVTGGGDCGAGNLRWDQGVICYQGTLWVR